MVGVYLGGKGTHLDFGLFSSVVHFDFHLLLINLNFFLVGIQYLFADPYFSQQTEHLFHSCAMAIKLIAAVFNPI
jgi:hypothetical protein